MHNFNRTRTPSQSEAIANLSIIEEYADSAAYSVWIPAASMVGQQPLKLIGSAYCREFDYNFDTYTSYFLKKPSTWKNGVVYLRVFWTLETAWPMPNQVGIATSIAILDGDEYPVLAAHSYLTETEAYVNSGVDKSIHVLDTSLESVNGSGTYRSANYLYPIYEHDTSLSVSVGFYDTGSGFQVTDPVYLVGVELVYRERKKMHSSKISETYRS